MSARIIRPVSAEISIATANTVANSSLVRVINTGATAVLHFTANTGAEYGNLTVTNTESVIVFKSYQDTLTGAGMLAVGIAYRD